MKRLKKWHSTYHKGDKINKGVMDIMELKQILLDEIPSFKASGEQFLEGTMSKMDFKKISGGFGVYAHRDGKSFMIRLRILSGVLSKNQLKVVHEIATKYQVELIHLTTRQAIQFHGLSLDDICEVMEEGLSHNIYTRGAGGSYPRNVAMSPLSGVDPEEVFDVVPYAMAVNAYFLKHIITYHLPRKLKVSFSSSTKDASHATVQDLGFVAVKQDGKEYFKVYAGGGLGRNPRKGIVCQELVEPKDVLFVVEALTKLYIDEGDYENHSKARVRHIVEHMGEEAFITLYKKYLDEAYAVEGLELNIAKSKTSKIGESQATNHPAIIPQKQEGLYTYYLHPIGGGLSNEILGKIIEVIEPMEDIQARLSMSEGMYLLNLTGKETQIVADELDVSNSFTHLERSRSCIGVPICQMGILNSQKTLKAIIERFREKEDVKDILPSIYISGCPNSCGVHQIGRIGLVGKKKKLHDAITEMFDVYIDGNCEEGYTQLGENYGDIPAEDVPECLYQLAQLVKDSEIDFTSYIRKEKEKVKTLIASYSEA